MWDRKAAEGETLVRIADDELRANWQAWADAFGREHRFDGDGTADEGQHKPGECGVIYVGPTSAASGASGFSSLEGSGALFYSTDEDCFYTYDGAAWVKRTFVKRAGDTLSANWNVVGKYIDGRDPSVDGTKLDGCSRHADETIAYDGIVYNGQAVPAPGGTWTKDDCKVFAHVCGSWALPVTGWTLSIACTVNPSTWVVSAAVSYYYKLLGGPLNVTSLPVYYLVVGAR